MAKYTTEKRRILLEFLESSTHKSFSAQQAYDALKMQDISKSAIYRNLAQLEKEGLLCRVTDNDHKETLYQYMNPTQCADLLHIVCKTCNQTFHINRHISQMFINMVKDDSHFNISVHTSLLYGTCESCTQKIENS